MKITSSYSVEIKYANKIFKDTIDIYRKAMSMCISIFDTEWNYLKDLDKLEQVNKAKDLIHSTKTVKAKYPEYDKTFYKLPIHLLIAIIKTSLGIVSSYHTNLDKGLTATLQVNTHKMPTFYKTYMYKGNVLEDNEIVLKLYHNKDWVWISFKLKKTDIDYIKKHCNVDTISSPTLERKNKKWVLTFTFKTESTLTKNKDKILAVDLGINTDAVCSVMLPNGTVIGRKFIDFPIEKDHIGHTLNKIKKFQKKYNNHNLNKLWREVNFHNQELSRKIVQMANRNGRFGGAERLRCVAERSGFLIEFI